jgi:hypothetical protein
MFWKKQIIDFQYSSNLVRFASKYRTCLFILLSVFATVVRYFILEDSATTMVFLPLLTRERHKFVRPITDMWNEIEEEHVYWSTALCMKRHTYKQGARTKKIITFAPSQPARPAPRASALIRYCTVASVSRTNKLSILQNKANNLLHQRVQ